MFSLSSAPGETGAYQHVRKVLVVDDDELFIDSITMMLSDARVVVAQCSGPEASTVIASFGPDLLLLDIMLGWTDAFTLIRTHLASKFDGVVSIISGLGLDTVMDVMLFGEKLGLSIGAPILKPISAIDMRQVLEAADDLLRRRSIVATTKQRKPATLKGVPLRLRQALDGDLLELWYQPKFDLKSGVVAGAEALIRARRQDGRIAGPYELLSDATRDDKAALTDFVIMSGSEHVETLSGIGFRRRLSFNVPVSYLLQPDPVRLIRGASTRHLWPGMIFEITEDEALGDIAELQAMAAQLRLYRIELSIDDFGAAYSSLERLRDLPFGELKLDRSFVFGCAVDSTKRSICRSVVALGAELGVTTVAEGVETIGDLEVIAELGCDQVQGYLFAKPMPFAALCEFVQTWTSDRLSPGREPAWGAPLSFEHPSW